MQPLINLKQFIAVLLLLSIPAALLVAYLRNYDPEAEGHQHSESTTHGTNRMRGEVENKTIPEQKPSQLDALREQVEASRMQFEASRLQLEASRKAVESLTAGKQIEKQPESALQLAVPMQQQEPSSSNDHVHKH